MTEQAAAYERQVPEGGEARRLILSHLRLGRTYEAIEAARTLLEKEPGRRTHRFLRSALEQTPENASGLKHVRVALLSSFSIEFLHDSLVALGLLGGMRIEIYQGRFGTFRQELLDPASNLYAWSPSAVFVAVEGQEWVPGAFAGDSDVFGQGWEEHAARFKQELSDLVASFRARSTAALLVHNLALPAWRPLGILDPKADHGQARIIGGLNDAMAAIAKATPDVHIVDYASLVNRHGALHWYDPRMNLYASAPIASAMQPHLSAEYVKCLAALSGLARKCLVLDLDNTLWGGVIGEDGLEGIRLGPTYPGNAYVAFQAFVLGLHRRGVILAIASKNNSEDVDEVFYSHRFNILKKEHFANIQIHWEAKSRSLVRIAEELSIGLEHVVFVDDNPVECEQVRATLPMVRVIQLPAQPERFVGVLEEAGLFDTLSVSSEDRLRGALYRQRAQAEAARLNVASVEDYYRDLAMELEISPVDRSSLARAAQLTQKTNQFNLTTLRCSEADMASRAADSSRISAVVGVKDRFGDNGIVGVIMASAEGETLRIDNMLLSCRVIGRTVETAMLAHLCAEGRRRGLKGLVGRFIPTKKNAPARDLFERHGFTKESEDPGGTTFWRLDLETGGVAWPSWFLRNN